MLTEPVRRRQWTPLKRHLLGRRTGNGYGMRYGQCQHRKEASYPAGVKIKRNAGFTGALVKVTGKGKLTVTGDGITAQDVDVSTAESGKGHLLPQKFLRW